MSIFAKLAAVQQSVKAPKGQFNSFGKYSYRSCEDIMEAVKPALGDLFMHVSDEIVVVGERYYVKATVTVSDGKETVTNTAFAREPESKKGMDDAQLTGATSSYARKYALAGMFALDDNKDPDSNEHAKQTAKPKPVAVSDDTVKETERLMSTLKCKSDLRDAMKGFTPELRAKVKDFAMDLAMKLPETAGEAA